MDEGGGSLEVVLERRRRLAKCVGVHESVIHDQWVHISDNQVRDCLLEDVLRCQAYLLFYQLCEPAS